MTSGRVGVARLLTVTLDPASRGIVRFPQRLYARDWTVW